MDESIVLSGSFTPTGKRIYLPLPCEIDWMKVYNDLTIGAPAEDTGAYYYWQRGMADNQGYVWHWVDAGVPVLTVDKSTTLGVDGFTLYNSSTPLSTNARAVTAITAGPQPTVSTGVTVDLQDGDIVRLYNVAGVQQLGGIDFEISNIMPAASFDLTFMRTIFPNAATTGSYRATRFGSMFYPRSRYITRISQAQQAIVTMSVTHQYKIGQQVRFILTRNGGNNNFNIFVNPFGMPQIDQQTGTIVAIGQADADGFTNTITVNIDTRQYARFTFPLNPDVPFTPAQVVPFGENTAEDNLFNQNPFGDRVSNTATMGMILGFDPSGNNLSPGGGTLGTRFWVAGQSANTSIVPIVGQQ